MAMAALSFSKRIAPQISRFRTLATTSLQQLPSLPLSPPIHHHHHHRLQTLSFSSRGMCHVAHAVKPGKTTVEDAKKIIVLAKRALSRREILHTDFLAYPVLKRTILALGKLYDSKDIKIVTRGGYPQAERNRLSVGHPEIMTTIPEVAALSISGDFGFEPCSHSDFLGSILGTGIAREKLGDIIIQVGNVSVTCTQIPLLALEHEPAKTAEELLQVEFIVSAGYKISRKKAVNLISNGDVLVNDSPVSNGATLKPGDMVYVIGMGLLKVEGILTRTNGEISVALTGCW